MAEAEAEVKTNKGFFYSLLDALKRWVMPFWPALVLMGVYLLSEQSFRANAIKDSESAQQNILDLQTQAAEKEVRIRKLENSAAIVETKLNAIERQVGETHDSIGELKIEMTKNTTALKIYLDKKFPDK